MKLSGAPNQLKTRSFIRAASRRSLQRAHVLKAGKVVTGFEPFANI